MLTSTKPVWLWLLTVCPPMQSNNILNVIVRLQWKSNPGKQKRLHIQGYWNVLVSIYFWLFLTDLHVISDTGGKLQQANQDVTNTRDFSAFLDVSLPSNTRRFLFVSTKQHSVKGTSLSMLSRSSLQSVYSGIVSDMLGCRFRRDGPGCSSSWLDPAASSCWLCEVPLWKKWRYQVFIVTRTPTSTLSLLYYQYH